MPACMVRSGYRAKSLAVHKLIRHPVSKTFAASAPAKIAAGTRSGMVVQVMVPQPRQAALKERSLSRLEENAFTNVLVRRCIAGDASAWEELVKQQNRRIYNICYRFTGSASDAEDLTQEVFIRLYRTMSSFEPDRGSFNTWLTTLTRNMLVDHFRRTRQERMTDSIDAAPGADENAPTLADRVEDQGPSPQARLASKETQKIVHQALQNVSPALRE